MDETMRDLFIGIVGSVIGAMIVYFASYGIRFTKSNRQKNQAERKKEIEKWQSKELGIRQGITNNYLFNILKYLLLGNIFWAIPSLSTFFSGEIYDWVNAIAGIFCVTFFFIGLANTIRYMRLRSLDK